MAELASSLTDPPLPPLVPASIVVSLGTLPAARRGGCPPRANAAGVAVARRGGGIRGSAQYPCCQALACIACHRANPWLHRRSRETPCRFGRGEVSDRSPASGRLLAAAYRMWCRSTYSAASPGRPRTGPDRQGS